MARNKDPIFLGSVVAATQSFNNADGTGAKTILVAGADGAAITNLTAVSTSSAAEIAVLELDDGSTTVRLGEVSIPIGAGTDGATAAKNLLDATAMPGVFQADGSLLLGAGATLSVKMKAAVTSGVVEVAGQGGQYAA
jgi:hypothetical protein